MGDIKEKVEESRAQSKPTYEELKNYCNQLMMQRNQLIEQVKQMTGIVNKLPWLFEVVKNQTAFNPGFVEACVEEIEAILTPPEESNTESTQESNKE